MAGTSSPRQRRSLGTLPPSRDAVRRASPSHDLDNRVGGAIGSPRRWKDEHAQDLAGIKARWSSAT